MGEPPAALSDNAAMLALSPGLRAHVGGSERAEGAAPLHQARPDCDVYWRWGQTMWTHIDAGLRQTSNAASRTWNDNDAAARMKPNNASHLYARGAAALKLRRVPEGQADIAAAKAVDFSIAGKFDRYRGNP